MRREATFLGTSRPGPAHARWHGLRRQGRGAHGSGEPARPRGEVRGRGPARHSELDRSGRQRRGSGPGQERKQLHRGSRASSILGGAGFLERATSPRAGRRPPGARPVCGGRDRKSRGRAAGWSGRDALPHGAARPGAHRQRRVGHTQSIEAGFAGVAMQPAGRRRHRRRSPHSGSWRSLWPRSEKRSPRHAPRGGRSSRAGSSRADCRTKNQRARPPGEKPSAGCWPVAKPRHCLAHPEHGPRKPSPCCKPWSDGSSLDTLVCLASSRSLLSDSFKCGHAMRAFTCGHAIHVVTRCCPSNSRRSGNNR